MTPADGAGRGAQALPSFKPLPMKGPLVEVERRADLVASLFTPGVMSL